jgi:hypothetical protein
MMYLTLITEKSEVQIQPQIMIEHCGQTKLKLNTSVYSPERCLCHIIFYNYKYINITLLTISAVFFTFICNETEWSPAR